MALLKLISTMADILSDIKLYRDKSLNGSISTLFYTIVDKHTKFCAFIMKCTIVINYLAVPYHY